jgi:lipopolysaccharide/colanic/teichoic acid biosynthesis glycosyltransferase
MSGPVFKAPADPRITRVGTWLRRFSIDEIPQFWNVLRGEMSLVGPRPPLPEEVAQYDARQKRRLAVAPGLTCTWQISGRNEIGFEEWVDMDLNYIDNWTFSRDLVLLALTVPAVLGGRGSY